jgi:glycerol-3-phosphate acyltransferase PlsX
MHNAVLGSNYAKAALGIENPRVSLLTIGTEEGKGNSLINASSIYLNAIDKEGDQLCGSHRRLSDF